jgi:hypothetical protein
VKFTYLSAEDLMWLMAVAEAKALITEILVGLGTHRWVLISQPFI